MYCTKCGKEYVEGAVVCMGCGCSLGDNKKVEKSDTSAFGFGVLGFFFPIVGLVLWLVWKDERPKRAKAAGIGALASVVFNVILVIVWGIIFSTVMMTAFSDIVTYGVSL